MATYKAPLREYKFILHEVLGVEEISSLPGYEDATPEIFDAVLEEAGKFCEEQLFPLNRSGDKASRRPMTASVPAAGRRSAPIRPMAGRGCRMC
jgi:hypothetical protein